MMRYHRTVTGTVRLDHNEQGGLQVGRDETLEVE
jgi:hypothetical protein